MVRLMREGFVKFRFVGKSGATAGLVLPTRRFEAHTITSISCLFPYSESRKMEKLEVSPVYYKWEDAFNHEFSA